MHGVIIPCPTTQGQVVRILDQSFFVVARGKDPETVKLFGPFREGQMSTRTVNWARFIRERISIV